jgi:hypothetical protein
LDNLDQHHDDGDDQKSMNHSTHGVAGHQSQPPQNQENYKNSPKHVLLLSSIRKIFLRALLPHDLLDLADLFLSFPGSLFVFAFGLQVAIRVNFPGDLLDLTLHLMPLAFRLVPCA